MFSIYVIWYNATGTGNIRVGGLPFSCLSMVSSLAVNSENVTFTGQLGALIWAGDQFVTPNEFSTGASRAELAMEADGDLIISGVYKVA
jgi:hypothetical protein